MKFRPVFVFLLALALAATAGAGAQKQQDQPSDDYLYDVVRRKLASDPVVKGGTLEVEVEKGVVTIGGDVELEKQKERATKVVKKIKGVRGVENRLRVVGKGGR